MLKTNKSRIKTASVISLYDTKNKNKMLKLFIEWRFIKNMKIINASIPTKGEKRKDALLLNRKTFFLFDTTEHYLFRHI